ncbi:MAG: TetR/AcrR family transcriptional regulator [Eubacteriales bacterium]|nr:TetR/AcrR family transcriptional regulator [Eubacteriales bacterium]
MNDKFFDLKQEKQDRMINAALKVFAGSGYKHASTDDIVKEAGISKGLLFHYFGSKIGLYGFLFDYSARFMLLELSREVSRSELDYFELVRQMERARMQVMKLYPYMQQFLNLAMREENAEAAARIEEKREDYRERMRAYSMQADYSVFAPYGDSDRIVRLTEYAIAGVTQEMTKRYDFTPEKLYGEICVYLDMLQRMTGRK